MEQYTQGVQLRSGAVITVSGRVLREWGGEIVRRTVESAHHGNGTPASGEEVQEATALLKPGV